MLQGLDVLEIMRNIQVFVSKYLYNLNNQVDNIIDSTVRETLLYIFLCDFYMYVIPPQALHWEVPEFKRGPGRPRTNWRSTVNKDLLRKGITWEEAEVAAQNRSEWLWTVAQCIHLDAV